MTISELGSLGEFISSVVVLATLIYLAIQTSETRKATQANLLWSRVNASRDLATMWVTNPESVELIEEFGTTEDAFPTSEEFDSRAFRYSVMNRAVMESLQAFFMTASTAEDKEMATQRIRRQMLIPGFRATWPTTRHSGAFYPAFIDVVDNEVEEYRGGA